MSDKQPEFDNNDMEPGDRDENFNPVDWAVSMHALDALVAVLSRCS